MGGFLGASARSFAGRIIGALSALVASFAITSTLTISESGVFFLALGFAIFFSHILRFGLDTFSLKKCAIFLCDSRSDKFLSMVLACIILCILGSALFYFLSHVVAWLRIYEYARFVVLAFPAAVAMALMAIVAHSLHAIGFVFSGTVTNIACNYILFAICVWLAGPESAEAAIHFFSISCFLALGGQLALAAVLYARVDLWNTGYSEARLSKVDYKEIYLSAGPLWFVVISQQMNLWGSQFISSVYVDESDLALLAIAMRIAMIVPMILTSVNLVVSPRFASLYHDGNMEQIEVVLKKSLTLLALVSSLIFVFLMIFGSGLLRLFGEQYVTAKYLLSILVCGQLVNALTGPVGRLLMMSGFERDIRNTSLLVTVIGLFLAFVLTSAYGVFGAVVATAITIASQNIIFAVLVNSRLNLSLPRIYLSMIRRTS